MNDKYYDGIAKGYDELHAEEQLKKLELIGKEITTNKNLNDFINPTYKLLDVGCGSGISTMFFKVKAKYGIDPSKGLINIAITNYPYAEFKIASAEQMPYKDNSFDIVTSLTAIQNFTYLEKGLSEIKRVGKKYFILTFLKKSSKKEIIDLTIKKTFKIIKTIEEDKDIIYFCIKN